MANKFEDILRSLEAARKHEFTTVVAWDDGFAVVTVLSLHKTQSEAWRAFDRKTGDPINKSEDNTEYFNKKLASGE